MLSCPEETMVLTLVRCLLVALAVALVVASFVFAPIRVTAQDQCPDQPTPGTESITPYVSKISKACPADSYIKAGTQYDTNFHTLVSGSCRVYVWDAVAAACVHHSTQYRGIGASTISEVGVSGWTAVYPNPNNFPPELDTRLSGSSTPDTPTWWFWYEGERTLKFGSNIVVTNCNLLPNSVSAEINFNVVKCEPKFETDSNGNIIRLPATKVHVALPSSMSAASSVLEDAITDWNNRLTGTGVEFEQTASCTSGVPCVQIGVNPSLMKCGETTKVVTDAQGLIKSGAGFNVRSDWTSYSTEGLRRTFIHELGHLLGLANYSDTTSCGPNTAAMHEGYNCAATPLDTLTFNDYQPAKKTTYGNVPRTATCGF